MSEADAGEVRSTLYQVRNNTREEIFYWASSGDFEPVLAAIRKDLRGPAKAWRPTDEVSWQPLLPDSKPARVYTLRLSLEAGSPPNGYTVIAGGADPAAHSG